jgi:hypothetical protein
MQPRLLRANSSWGKILLTIRGIWWNGDAVETGPDFPAIHLGQHHIQNDDLGHDPGLMANLEGSRPNETITTVR